MNHKTVFIHYIKVNPPYYISMNHKKINNQHNAAAPNVNALLT